MGTKIVMIFGWLIVLVSAPIIYKSFNDINEIQDKGNYYLTQCKLIEINIDNGFFSDNTNKLMCNGVIENVSTNYYNSAVKSFKK